MIELLGRTLSLPVKQSDELHTTFVEIVMRAVSGFSVHGNK